MKTKYPVIVFGVIPNFVIIADNKIVIDEVIMNYKPKKEPIVKSRWWSIVLDDKTADYSVVIYQKLKCLKLSGYAFVYHDKDITDNKHYHILINTIQPTTLKSIAKLFEVRSNKVERVTIPNKMKRYLLHRDNPEKHQYENCEVRTNFRDFEYVVSRDDLVSDSDNSSDYSKVYEIINTCQPHSFRDLVLVVQATNPELIGFVSRNCYAFKEYIKNIPIVFEDGQKKAKTTRNFFNSIDN